MSAKTSELHGLAVHTEVPLDGVEVDRAPDWHCSIGPARAVDGPPPGRLIGEIPFGELGFWATTGPGSPRRWILRYGATAETILELDARTITIHPDPRADEGLAPLLLAGSGLAHALAADGVAALHASAVEADGSAISFIGPSGQGKSTIAGLLCANGFPAVTDDLLRCEVITEEKADQPRAFCFRGGTRMRLRPQAARLAEEIGMGAEASVDGRVCAIAAPTRHRRLPLAAIVVPRPSRTEAHVIVERLRGRRAAAELLRSPRLPGWIEPSLIRLHFELSERLANAVPILEATIPWGPPFPPGLATELVGGILSNA